MRNIYIVLEFCEGGDLQKIIEESAKQNYFTEE